MNELHYIIEGVTLLIVVLIWLRVTELCDTKRATWDIFDADVRSIKQSINKLIETAYDHHKLFELMVSKFELVNEKIKRGKK
jgi:hypothetical protein